MRLNQKTVGLLVIAAGVLVAAAYALDAQYGRRAGHPDATPKAAPASVPGSHPRVAGSFPPAGADAREGKAQVDPARAFTHFRVGNNSVRAIHADGSVMWMGTSGGMVRYDTVTHEFKTYDTSSGLLSKGIFHLGKLQGKIAVGTYGGGLSLLDPDAQRWEHYNIPEGLGDAFVYDVLEASNGDVWVATGSGVNRVRGGALKERAKWELYDVENTGGGLPHNRVIGLAQGAGGSVWCATEGGLARFQNGKWSTRTHPDVAFDRGHISALKGDEDGQIWVGTRGAGLARFDGKAWTNFTMAGGLPSNRIFTLHLDRNGRLWIGTDKGLALFKDGKFPTMTTAHGLLGEHVYSVTTTRDGGMWVGSFGGISHIRQPALN